MGTVLDDWAHDLLLYQTLADVADTPTDRLTGSEFRTGVRGVPLAMLRYIETDTLRIDASRSRITLSGYSTAIK